MAKRKRTGERPIGAPRRRRRLIERVLFAVGVVVLLDALFGERGLMETRRARQHWEAMEARIASLRKENDALREEIRRLGEDPSMIEDVARRELGLIRPGEKLFIIKDIPAEPR